MKVGQKRRWKMFVVAGATMALVTGMVSTVPSVYAGGMIKADDDKWISIGMGIRQSFNKVEDGSANGSHYSNQFDINNARIYINGGIHKYVKFTFNTECFACAVPSNTGFASNSNIGLIDAIGKFEFTELVNFWVGRTLVPTERGELNGPFYHAVFDGFRTPFNQADFSGNFGNQNGAGLYGRDNGVVFFGKVHPGGTHLLYVASVFNGLRSNAAFGPNQRDSLKYAGRLQWNLLNDEDNPGYYTSGTYYGTAGDILAIAVSGEYQNAGSGSLANPAPFRAFVTDILFEKVLPGNMGVFTANGEFKRYWGQDLAAFAAGPGCFCMFTGSSWTGYALYLFPNEIGIGKFQPYGRYTGINSQFSGAFNEFELGLNYVISGHNARASAYWRTGDSPGPFSGDWSNTNPTGQHTDSFHVALQLQY